MDFINLGLGTPDVPFDFEMERQEILKRIAAAIESGEVPPHLRTKEVNTVTNSGRKMTKEELDEVKQFDDYVMRLYDTCEWKQALQHLRDRLARLPPIYNTYSLLFHAEANCGALDMAAVHAKEAYNWDPLMSEAYIMMAKLDCVAMLPDRAESWLELASLVPGYKDECGTQVEATRSKIVQLRAVVDTVLADVTPLFCLPDFWVRLSKNVEYYRTFSSDETRSIISQVQRDPSSLRHHLKHEKVQWLVTMLRWTPAALTYSLPNEEQLATRHMHKVQAAQTSQLIGLPNDILLDILDYADPPTLGRMLQVCKFTNIFLTDDHRIWKRLYLNYWDPPIIYQVPDWMWVHAFRQRYGLCLTLARIWNRRHGDYSPTCANWDTNIRFLLAKFSFVSLSFADSLSLTPDFLYGNVRNNKRSITQFQFSEVESSEPWPALSPHVEAIYGDSDSDTSSSLSSSRKEEEMMKAAQASAIPTSAKPDPEASGYLEMLFERTVHQTKGHFLPEPVMNPHRNTRNKALPVFSFTAAKSLFDSPLINVCYFVLSRGIYGEESPQAVKALAALAFKNPEVSHHLIQLGAIQHYSKFILSDQYGDAADLLATLLLHRHGVMMEAAESLHSACRIFPRLWTLNVVQDLKEAQRWVVGLSGVWRGRFFLGVPGYDVPFVEHFLYLQFHPEINFAHFLSHKEVEAVKADLATIKIKPEYKFTSSGYVPPSDTYNVQDDVTEEGALFDADASAVQEGEVRITGSGLDAFGYYRVFGRLNVAFKTIYLAKRYEFEPPSTQQAYLGGDLGIWGMGGAIKTPTLPYNGVWKMWKDSTDYSLDQLHQMRLEAETAYLDSVKAFRARTQLVHRLRTNLTRKLFPNAIGIIGSLDGIHAPAPPPPQAQPTDVATLRRGLRWNEIDPSVVDALVDPLPPPNGPSLTEYNGIEAVRPTYNGYLPDSMKHLASDDSFVWYDNAIDYGPPLPLIESTQDEVARVNALCRRPIAARMNITAQVTFGHCDVLVRIIDWTNSMFQLEHMHESMFALASFEQDILEIPMPRTLAETPPIRRFQGEPDDSYIQRRTIFARLNKLVGQQRYIMIVIHQEQARLDAAYLLRQDIPFDDPRKLHITHRWVDDWLRHPVRMYVTDQARLQVLLAKELLHPTLDLPCFYYDALNEETEHELIKSHVMKPASDLPDNDEDVLEDEFMMEEGEALINADVEQNLYDRRDIVDNTTPGETTRATNWLATGIAILTVGIALAVGIRLLAVRNRK